MIITNTNYTLSPQTIPMPKTSSFDFNKKLTELKILADLNLVPEEIQTKITLFSKSTRYLSFISTLIESLAFSLCSGTPALVIGGIICISLATGPIGAAVISGVALIALAVGILASAYFSHSLLTKQQALVEELEQNLKGLLIENKNLIENNLKKLEANPTHETNNHLAVARSFLTLLNTTS